MFFTFLAQSSQEFFMSLWNLVTRFREASRHTSERIWVTGEFTAPGMYWRDTEIAGFSDKIYKNRRERGLTTRLTRCEFQFSFSWSKNSWWPDALFVTRFSALVWAETGQIQIMIQFSCTMQGLNTNLTANGRSKKVGSLCCHRTAPEQFVVVNAGLASFKFFPTALKNYMRRCVSTSVNTLFHHPAIYQKDPKEWAGCPLFCGPERCCQVWGGDHCLILAPQWLFLKTAPCSDVMLVQI